MIGIYKITSPSGRVYIGQSWDILHRWVDYGRLTARYQRLLCFSFNKYGKKSHKFEVVHELPPDVSQEVMNNYEDVYISAHREAGVSLLNLRGAGANGKPADETRKKQSEARRGKKPWNYGLRNHLKPEVVETIRKKATGVKQSKETIEKRMLQIRGRKNSDKHKYAVGAKKAKLTKEQAVEVKGKYKPRVYTLEMLAKEYGVQWRMIWRIIHNKTHFYA